LARHKCLNVFPVLKSVYFPPSSLHLPLLRTAAPEPTHDYWGLVLEYDALPWRWACNGPKCSVFQLYVLTGKGLWIVFAGKGRSSLHRSRSPWSRAVRFLAELPHALDKGSRSVTGPSQNDSNPLSLFVQRCVCKQDTPSSPLYQGCGLSGEIDTSGVGSGNRLHSLHLTKDMQDINLAAWHLRKMWGLIMWKIQHDLHLTNGKYHLLS